MSNIRDAQPEPIVLPLSLDGTESLTFDVGGISGWAAYHSPATASGRVMIQLRFAPMSSEPDAAIDLRELRVAATEGASFISGLLRTLPFERIVASVNKPSTTATIRPLLAPTNLVYEDTPGSAQWTYTLPPRELARLPRPKLRVEVPAGRRKPDEFYARVADAYLSQATISNRPAQDMALANDLPVTTIHRWLKEARARGVINLPNLGKRAATRRGDQ